MIKNIGLTGGIGAGKSGFMRRLKEEFPDANVFSVDEEVKVMYTDPIWREYLVSTYGTADKRKISAMAFDDPAMLQDIVDQSLDFLTPAIRRWLQTPGINIIEFPLLFEFNYEKKFDVVALITAPIEVRIDRVMRRDNKSKEQVEAIIRQQMSEDEKASRADFIIDTEHKTPGSTDYDEAVLHIKTALSQPNQARPLCVKA